MNTNNALGDTQNSENTAETEEERKKREQKKVDDDASAKEGEKK